MDNNLAAKLTSYNFLLVILFIFLIIAIVTFKLNSNAFSYTFGYEIFITIPFLFIIVFLIKEILVFKYEPTASMFYKYDFSNSTSFIPLMIMLTLAIALGGFFSVLAAAGIFDSKPPANNSSIIMNIALMFLFIIIASFVYFYSQEKDKPLLNQIPIPIQNIYNLRTKWTIYFVAFIVFTFLLYLVNPGQVMTNYGGPVIFFMPFIGLIMFSMISIYQYFLANPAKSNLLDNAPGFVTFLIRGFYIIIALTLSGLMIYGLLQLMGVLDQNGSSNSTWKHYIIDFILFATLIGILYKLLTTGRYFERSPVYRIIVNTILYIPCLAVYVLNYLAQLLGLSSDTSSGFSPATPSEKKVLIGALVIIIGYFLLSFFAIPLVQTKMISQGGKQYINEPISLNSINNIASYQELNNITNPDIHNYQYAISFWFYIDSFPPSTNISYTKPVSILSLANNPSINYDAQTNTLFITVQQSSEPVYNYIKESIPNLSEKDIETWKEVKINIKNIKELQSDADTPTNNTNKNEISDPRVLYRNSDVLLQKWNNIILNYNGGTLDVFYNGELVKSAIEVVPYLKYDMLTVGSDNGISGSVSNLVYFNNPIDAVTVSNIYNTLKHSNPPILTGDKNNLWSFS